MVAASYFEAKELIAFGVSHSAFDVQNPFVEDNEFEKAFKLWDSPFYLRKFFNDNIEYFKQEYWIGITEDEFVRDVTKSLNDIRKELINLLLIIDSMPLLSLLFRKKKVCDCPKA